MRVVTCNIIFKRNEQKKEKQTNTDTQKRDRQRECTKKKNRHTEIITNDKTQRTQEFELWLSTRQTMILNWIGWSQTICAFFFAAAFIILFIYEAARFDSLFFNFSSSFCCSFVVAHKLLSRLLILWLPSCSLRVDNVAATSCFFSFKFYCCRCYFH